MIRLKEYIRVACLSTVGLLLVMCYLIGGTYADSLNPGVYSIDSLPYGHPYSQWVAKYWQWAISIPKANDPLNDPTGAKCSVNQNDPKVWFLREIPSGSGVLSCTVPEGRAILTPILAGECDYLSDPEQKTEADLAKCALSGIQGGTMGVTVDGVALKNPEKYVVESPLFNFTIPADNTFGPGPTGTTQAKAVGYYVFLQPLSPGEHTIHESYSILDNPTLGTTSAAVDETYKILVKP